jgi:hypothetical protein
VTGTAEPRLPIDVGVSDTMRQIEDKLRFYARVLLEETDDWAPTTSTMPGLMDQVARRYGHFTSRSGERMALDFCDDAHEMRRMVSGTLAQHLPPHWQGPCPADECPGEIYQRDGMTDAVCRVCGRVVGPAEWRAIMRVAFDERLMTRSEMVSALHVVKRTVKPNTLDRWVQRGRIVPVVVDPDLFRFADAYELAERYDLTKDERMMSA